MHIVAMTLQKSEATEMARRHNHPRGNTGRKRPFRTPSTRPARADITNVT
jgi:hypothetical protein